MDDFGDDLFDEFENPSSSSTSVEPKKSDTNQQNPEEKYVNFRVNILKKPNCFFSKINKS